MSELQQHDIDALLEQADRKEALGSQMLKDKDANGVWHLVDAAEAFERAGALGEAERIRALLPATEKEASQKAADEPEADTEPSNRQGPSRRRKA